MTTDRGIKFSTQCWDWLCSHLSMNHWLSTAFHPQTDSQTVLQNQTIEQYLQAFRNYKQDNCVESLLLAEFAYNNSIHHVVLMTAFWVNYNYHPTMQFKPPKNAGVRSKVQADSWMAGMEETHRMLWKEIIGVLEHQTKYADRIYDFCSWR